MNVRTSARRFAAIVLFAVALHLHSQAPAPVAPASPATDMPALDGVTLQVHVNAVLVPVVVRDAQGHAVGNLKQADFKVFDQGKQRAITGFTLLQQATTVGAQSAVVEASNSAVATMTTQPSTAAKRFIVFLFDDRHLAAGDLEQVKKSSVRMLDGPLGDGDRAVVLSFSGINSGMTHDRVPLQAAILKLKAHDVNQRDAGQCPNIDYYTADQILNKHSQTEYQIALERAANCSHMGSKTSPGYVEQLMRAAANQSLLAGDTDVRETLGYLRDVVHSMSKLQGQRTLILVSPGFFSSTDEALALQSQILNLAASLNVTISALDAQGLSGGNLGASHETSGSAFSNITGQPVQDHLESMRVNEEVMAELADGTGGTFFRNNNELTGGLKKLAAGPENLYLLEVSLQNVKLNGTYHSLKVEVDQSGLKLQARKGYFAPGPPNKK